MQRVFVVNIPYVFVITVIPKLVSFIWTFVVNFLASFILQCFIIVLIVLHNFFNVWVPASFDNFSIIFDSLINLYGGQILVQIYSKKI